MEQKYQEERSKNHPCKCDGSAKSMHFNSIRIRLSQHYISNSTCHDGETSQGRKVGVTDTDDASHQCNECKSLEVLELGHLAVIELEPSCIRELTGVSATTGVRVTSLRSLFEVRECLRMFFVELSHELSAEIGSSAPCCVEVLDKYITND